MLWIKQDLNGTLPDTKDLETPDLEGSNRCLLFLRNVWWGSVCFSRRYRVPLGSILSANWCIGESLNNDAKCTEPCQQRENSSKIEQAAAEQTNSDVGNGVEAGSGKVLFGMCTKIIKLKPKFWPTFYWGCKSFSFFKKKEVASLFLHSIARLHGLRGCVKN